MPVAWA